MDRFSIKNIFNRTKKKEGLKIPTQEIIEQTPKEERVSKLIELGVLTDLDGYAWGYHEGNKLFVFANINGVPIPMYKTLSHTDGKRIDLKFYVFFGIQNNGEPWVIKGDLESNNTFYGINGLEEISKVLTVAFDFDTQENNYSPIGKKVEGDAQLNQLLTKHFGIDFDKINKMPRTFAGAGLPLYSSIIKALEKFK